MTTGRAVAFGDSYTVVDQAWVQHHPAAGGSSRTPVVFVHGGGLTGSMWETTPDGRRGWAPTAAALGWPVYVLDTVDAGRSGYAPPHLRSGEAETKSARQIWARYRIGPDHGWPAQTPYEGTRFPIEHLEALVASHVPRRRTTDQAEKHALLQAVSRIGHCHLIAHSHGAVLCLEAAAELDAHVDRLIAIEPAPIAEIPDRAAPTLIVWGDHLRNHDLWSPMLPIYQRSQADHLDLTTAGMTGSTHVPMCDRDSDGSLRLMLRWLGGDGPGGRLAGW